MYLNLIPYVPSEIRLDDANLPLNTEFEEIALQVAPKTKSAVLLDFNIKIIKSIEMTVFDSTVSIEGLDETI
ncbi:pilus assembly protein FimD [Rickettsia rhipicephali]|uniref:pilus assembly protein FimD n=1 Tax=Rickettsia rhipicephali TaxID=33992 RepID=UPI0009E9B535|nr:pilus assembly protein FimD [Rickettsia rhipicephali]